MSYYDEAIELLKQNHPQTIPEFQRLYAVGRAKILAAQKLFRLMSPDEATVWNRVAPPTATNMNASLMRNLFVGGGYARKWFTFDRPYLFGRQTINQLGEREGQGLLMVILLGHEMKNTLLKKLLPDTNLQGIPEHMKTDSSRCKNEGGTITLGIPLPVLEKMAINMNIEHVGARITPR
jgi:hypothetical protein